MLALALADRNNHWMTYVTTPVEVGAVLWAVSHWQVLPLSARILQTAIPGSWVGWILMVLFVENVRTFSLVAQPVLGLFVMGAAIWTMASRTAREPGPLRNQDWLWISMGVAIYFGGAVALPPASYLLVPKSPALVVRAYEVRGALNILAFLLIARGVLCPKPKPIGSLGPA